MRLKLTTMKSDFLEIPPKSTANRQRPSIPADNDTLRRLRVSQPSESSSDTLANSQVSLSNRAKEISAKYSLSLRQAYRYAKRGTVPAGERRIGLDGKRYFIVSTHTIVLRELSRGVCALKRADKQAYVFGITQEEIARLETLVSESTEVLSRWRQAA